MTIEVGDRIALSEAFQAGLGGPDAFNCISGFITTIRLKFPKTPALTKTVYHIRFDHGIFTRPILEQVYELALDKASFRVIG